MNAENWKILLSQLLMKRGLIQTVRPYAIADIRPFCLASGTPIHAGEISKIYAILQEIFHYFLIPTQPFGLTLTHGTLTAEENFIVSEWLEEKGLTLTPPLPTRGVPTVLDYQHCLENALAIVELLSVLPLEFFQVSFSINGIRAACNLHYRKCTIYNTFRSSENLANTDHNHEEEGAWETFEDGSYSEWFWHGNFLTVSAESSAYSWIDSTSGLQKHGRARSISVTIPKNQPILHPKSNLLMQYCAQPFDYYTFDSGDSGLSQTVFPVPYHVAVGGYYDNRYHDPSTYTQNRLHSEHCPCGSSLSPIRNLGRWDTSGNITIGSQTLLPYHIPTPTSSHTNFSPATSFSSFYATLAFALQLL